MGSVDCSTRLGLGLANGTRCLQSFRKKAKDFAIDTIHFFAMVV
jgi:hypothetical protein